jgi:EAL domain-containing protein (putative c-di-GMP-specific phosphodiesterase class I)
MEPVSGARPGPGSATEPADAEPRPSVLVVDDEVALLRAYVRSLEMHGFRVEAVESGSAAIDALRRGSFDVILSDIDMPGMNGLRLLERVREHDLDVPVVLITGAPSVETAAHAMEHGALRYLVKPVHLDALIKATSDAVKLHRIARAKRQAIDLAGGVDRLVGDHAGLENRFARALATLEIAYQPIVSWTRQRVYAYEALLRSREPSLPHPGAVLDAAERLGRGRELGRRIRQLAVAPLADLQDDVILFLNLHPNDLLDDELFSDRGPVADCASRIVLEITERASLHGMADVPARVARLRDRGFRIAVDDLGAGYAGLVSFALLEPDIVKLDMELVRHVHLEPTKQALVRTMVTMCRELGITVTAEGIETVEERDELIKAGCDLLQGYLFGRAEHAFLAPRL